MEASHGDLCSSTCFLSAHSLIFTPFPSLAGLKPHNNLPEGKMPGSFPVTKVSPPRHHHHHHLFKCALSCIHHLLLPSAVCRVSFCPPSVPSAAIFLLLSTVPCLPSSHLSIWLRHLCWFAAVAEAHILIATRWGGLAALTQPCAAGLRARTHRLALARCWIQMAFACWQSCH